jgi:hypothetical protein
MGRFRVRRRYARSPAWCNSTQAAKSQVAVAAMENNQRKLDTTGKRCFTATMEAPVYAGNDTGG